jgi:hypothetical protein
MVWGLQMPSDACVPQTADKGKQEVLGVQCPEAALLAQTCGESLCNTYPPPRLRWWMPQRGLQPPTVEPIMVPYQDCPAAG